jgi:hypothetical protein
MGRRRRTRVRAWRRALRRFGAARGVLVISAALLTVIVALLLPPLRLEGSPVLRSIQITLRPTPTTAVPSSAQGSALTLGIADLPSSICAFDQSSCPAGLAESRVMLSAQAETAPSPYWPNVQVAFVIETTAYDGFYYHYFGYPGTDKCALADDGEGAPCEESNGGPFFLAHAQQVADEIAQANPHSNVSFAMVDFFGTNCGDWNDCGDSSMYNVDIPQFIPAADFGSAVGAAVADNTFGGGFIQIVGLDDNFLHSPVITALYGTIIGSGLDWSPNTHHVIVVIGSTAPRDPSYVEDYAVSPFDSCCGGSQPDGWTCEPSYVFSNGVSPNCEGWVHSQDGNPNDSIAALAHTSPTCADSIGHTCTIDYIDLWDTADDPLSQSWPTGLGTGSGPGGSIVVTNTEHVIEAGCDIAAATGGTWDGPTFATCPDGQSGSLAYVPHGPVLDPNTGNPTLLAALRQVGFGPVYQTLVANGSNAPMFNFAPIGAIHVASSPGFTASCLLKDGRPAIGCQQAPTIRTINGIETLGWNFSTLPADNVLYVGDTWTASFNVFAGGPPLGEVPVDACTTAQCHAGNSGAVAGEYTWAYYVPRSNGSAVHQSFPLATLNVELAGSGPPVGLFPPAPPIAPPGVGIPIVSPVPVAAPVAVAANVGIATASLNAAAAGFLGAGFVRVTMKNKPIAMQVAALRSKSAGSKFDQAAREGNSHVGKFE